LKALLFSYVEYKISQWAPNSNTLTYLDTSHLSISLST